MSHSIAIIGFRHPHIQDLIGRVQARGDLQLVAACEEDETARAALIAYSPDTPIFSSK